MADNRIYLEFPFENTNHQTTTWVTRANYESYIVWIRDRFRALFVGPQFVVSDIAMWQGSAAAMRGYCFILRDTTHGHEFLFFFKHFNSGTASSEYWYAVVGNNYATTSAYFKYISNGDVTDLAFVIGTTNKVIMNKSYATATPAMGFTNTTTMTYGAGDFTAPAVSPYTDLAGFLLIGSGSLPSICADNYQNTTSFSAQSVLYDPSIGVLRLDSVYGSNTDSAIAVFKGKIFKSYADGGLENSNDNDQYGILTVPKLTTGTEMPGNAVTSSGRVRGVFTEAGGTVRLDGTVGNWLGTGLTRFTYKDPVNNMVAINPILIQNGTYIKGYVDPRIACEALPRNDAQFRRRRVALPDADNPMVKDHSYLISMWKKNTPLLGEAANPAIINDYNGIYT